MVCFQSEKPHTQTFAVWPEDCPLEPAQVVEAFKILTGDSQVKAILVNIFGKQQ